MLSLAAMLAVISYASPASAELKIGGYSEESSFEALVNKIGESKKIAFNRVGFIRDRKYIALAVKSKIATASNWQMVCSG